MMASATCAGLLVLLAAAPALSAGAEVTPVQKVLQLMDELLAKAEKEKKAEEVRFSAFSQWCDDQTRIKNNEIADANEKIEMLKAEIEKARVEIEKLTERIDELDEDVGRWQKDGKSATEVRDKEAEDYKVTLVDYEESLAALDQAILVLKKQAYHIPQGFEESLLQVQRQKLVPASAKQAIAAYLQEAQPSAATEAHLDVTAPEAYGYSFQSGGIIDMLEKLKDDFATKKREMMAEELNARYSYEQIMQVLADSIENAEHEIKRKTELRAETEQLKADKEGELAQTISDRDEDQKYLDDMTALCELKKSDFESRQKLRAEEIEAVEKAKEIIASESVAGAAEKHLPTLVQLSQTQGAPALAQLRSKLLSPEQAQAAQFLADRAKTTGSRLLSMISQRAAEDPFKKVKKMIKDLIQKLMEEATAETEHKGWCDAEVGANKITREAKTEDVNKLTQEVEDLEALIAELTQAIADLTVAVQELDAAMAKATSDREASKEKNAETIADAKEAQTAVENAIAILKEFYAKSAQATALAQQTPAEDAPETFDKPYKGLLPEGGSVVDFLEVILSDFARLQSDTETAEAQEAEEYETFMFESKKDKALKENEIKHKTEKKTESESTLAKTQEELKLTQEQLDKAIAYYEKLKPTCIDSGITYEDRVKRREEEIQSLKEALVILKGEDMPSALDRSGDTD